MKTAQTRNLKNAGQLRGLRWLKALVMVLALAGSSIPTQAALLAHWTFDESSGPTAHDSAGLLNGDLSPNGAVFVSGGVSGNAISLDRASNGFVTMGNVLDLTCGDFSLVAWVKMNAGDTTDQTVVLSKHAAFADNGYLIGINSLGGGGQVNKAVFYEGHIGGAPVSTNSVNDGNWHQIVAVYQAGGNKSIYVDGAPAEVVQPSETFLSTSAPFLIGGDTAGPSPRGLFTGLIDDVQIYSQVLSDSDVDFLFQHPGQVVPECSQQLAAANAEIDSLRGQLASCSNALASANQDIQDLQIEITGLLLPFQLLTKDFQTTFKDSQFQIPGATAVDQMQNLVGAIEKLPLGQQQALFMNLGGKKNNDERSRFGASKQFRPSAE